MVELQKMVNFPRDGKFYLCFDADKEPKVLNCPDGYAIGTWHKRKDGTWGGGAVNSYYKPNGWCEVPKVKFVSDCEGK